ncbi:MAG TPA: outer membrane beta-barrel protein [Methylocystis sp.]|nr:outer membrane beta-barrel protein [Methylocystis sp.]
MKKIAAISTIALAMGLGSALAADLPYRKAPLIEPPPPPLTWNGFYAGLNIGGGWTSNNNNNNDMIYWDPNFAFGSTVVPPFGGFSPNIFFLPTNTNQSGTNGGVVGGGQVGYNFQFNPSIVVGAEADFQGSSIGNNDKSASTPVYASPFANPFTGAFTDLLFPIAPNAGHVGVDWIGTIRGRAGWLFMPSLLVYGTGGFAYAGVYAGGYNNSSTGWTVGGGLEWMLAPNISAKIEYLYVELSNGNNNNNWGWNWGYNQRPQINIVRAGVNYHFNWAAPAPILAKY